MASATSRAERLERPAVAPELYDEDYYLHCCAGADEWRTSGGAQLSGLYAGSLSRAGFAPGEVLVDVGCGRGELVAVAAAQGAARAVGVEYSAAAVRLARRTIERHGVADRTEIIQADARAMPVADGSADLVTLLDVVEHLTAAELDATLREALRVLRPGGRIVVHTMPNRLIYDVTYRVLRRVAGPGWPADPRIEAERIMHVNEQTRRELLRSLRAAGFADATVVHGGWIHDRFVPRTRLRRIYGLLARHRVTRPLGAADLWGLARRAPA